MLRSVKREFLLNLSGIWQMLAILGGAWLLGETISLCATYFAHEEEYFSLGVAFSIIFPVLFSVIFALYYFSCGYEQALKMSCTRRNFLAGMFAAVCLQLVCMLAGIVLLALLDRGVCRLLFGDIAITEPDILSPRVLSRAWLLLPAIPAIACVGLFLGACVQRWGRRALWLLWAVYMAVVLFGDTFAQLAEGAGRDTLLGRALGFAADLLALIPGGAVRIVLALAGLAAITITGVVMLLRGSVRQTA